jgi:hypothetical protein
MRAHLSIVGFAILLCSLIAPVWAGEVDLTFLAWSDQHVKASGDAEHLRPAIQAMHTVVGQVYPPEIGGKVSKPQFVLGCGDCTDRPTRATVSAYNAAVTQRLGYKSYDIMGNHDEGDASAATRLLDQTALLASLILGMAVVQGAYLALGLRAPLRQRRGRRLAIAMLLGVAAGWLTFLLSASGNDAMQRWIVSRHGGTSYSFDQSGVHFVMVFSKYSPHQTITRDALEFIGRDLAKLPKGMPVVVALHYCYEAIGNRDELIAAFGDAKVVLVLGGHYHQASTNEYRGIHFVQVASPRTATQFTVVRLAGGRVTAVPYDFKRGAWSERTGARLDAVIEKGL